jgi:hypothetical protein
MHTDSTIKLLEEATVALGTIMCCFNKDVCANFDTKETNLEVSKQNCQATAAAKQVGRPIPVGNGKHRKYKFNLNTVKLHFLGDYAASICHYGTTDLCSTDIVCYIHILIFVFTG